MTARALTLDETLRQEHAWLAAHAYNLHNRHVLDPCGCEFCCWYRGLHGDKVDPWVGPWTSQVVVMR